MVDRTGRKLQAGLQVLGFEVWHFLEDLFGGQPGGEEIENIRHANTHAADARSAAALFRINGDSLGQFHSATIATVQPPRARGRRAVTAPDWRHTAHGPGSPVVRSTIQART